MTSSLTRWLRFNNSNHQLLQNPKTLAVMFKISKTLKIQLKTLMPRLTANFLLNSVEATLMITASQAASGPHKTISKNSN